jgi:hypothetical protein
MSYHDVKPYVTYLSIFQVAVCRFCEVCLSPKDPLEHYKRHHTAKSDHPVPTKVRNRIADYMTTLNLRPPQEVIAPRGLIPELKIIKEGFKCNFPGCGSCATSEHSMRTHYYIHQKHIPKNFKDWESTAIQTFFDGHHKKYDRLFIP